ncbi:MULTISPECIES: hypothetical protein [Hyphobacterium]|uniref:Uncharacterized protein n=1 Tax=Hyphobacterium vulgare TaxID=1736751 RepID=A0ABV6ZXE0_9PROT
MSINDLSASALSDRPRFEFPYANAEKFDIGYELDLKWIEQRVDALSAGVKPLPPLENYAYQLGFSDTWLLSQVLTEATEECLRYRAQFEQSSGRNDLKIIRRQLRSALKQLKQFRETIAALVRSEGSTGFNMSAPSTWRIVNQTYAAILSAAHIVDDAHERVTRFETGRDPSDAARNIARANSFPGAIENIECSLTETLRQIDAMIPKGHSRQYWKAVNAEQIVLSWLSNTCGFEVTFEQRLPHGRNRSREFLASALGSIWGGGTTLATREKYVASASRRILLTYKNRDSLLSERPTLQAALIDAQAEITDIPSSDTWDLLVLRQLRQEEWEKRLKRYRQPPRLTSGMRRLARHGSERWPIPLEP